MDLLRQLLPRPPSTNALVTDASAHHAQFEHFYASCAASFRALHDAASRGATFSRDSELRALLESLLHLGESAARCTSLRRAAHAARSQLEPTLRRHLPPAQRHTPGAALLVEDWQRILSAVAEGRSLGAARISPFDALQTLEMLLLIEATLRMPPSPDP